MLARDVDRGAVTADYALDLKQAVDILNKVLASELVCVLRYKAPLYMAQACRAEPIAQEFLQHANDGRLPLNLVAVRIARLRRRAELDPAGILERSVAECDGAAR